MDKLKTSATGGFPFVLNDIRQFLGRLSGSQGIYQAFNNLLRGFGDDFIVQGVVASGTTPNIAITEGWVLLAGELLKVDAQTGISTNKTFVKVTTFDSRGNKTFQNATVEDTYEKNRAVATGTGGNLAFNGDTLVELTTGADTLPDVGKVALIKKVIEIGDWDMDADIIKDVTHGVSDFTKIRTLDIMIRRDDNLFLVPLGGNFSENGTDTAPKLDAAFIDSTKIRLVRLANSLFDQTTFNATSFNRGWVTIEFEA